MARCIEPRPTQTINFPANGSGKARRGPPPKQELPKIDENTCVEHALRTDGQVHSPWTTEWEDGPADLRPFPGTFAGISTRTNCRICDGDPEEIRLVGPVIGT